MSMADPYHAVQHEIQTSLQTAAQLGASYVRIRNMAVREDSEELVWARNEVGIVFPSSFGIGRGYIWRFIVTDRVDIWYS